MTDDPTPVPEPIWIFDHRELCGNLIRVKESDLTGFVARNRGECLTCYQPLGEPRPATDEDW